jgi:hypothetical protein
MNRNIKPEHVCERACGQRAAVYAINPRPGGWGGRYCRDCVFIHGLHVIDRALQPAR